MHRSIYTKGMLLVGLVLATVTITTTIWVAYERNLQLELKLKNNLNEITELQAAAVSDAVWNLNRDTVRDILSGINTRRDFISARVILKKGMVFSEVTRSPPAETGVPNLTHTANIVINDGGNIRRLGHIEVSISLIQLNEQQQRSLWNALGIGLVQLIAVLLGTFLVLHMIIKPLASLKTSLVTLANGDTNPNIPAVDRLDQIGDMARAVEEFRKSLIKNKQLQNEVRKHQELLEQTVIIRTHELQVANKKLKRLSETDPLTKIPNRRFYNQRITSDIAIAKRTGKPLSMLMIDIDFFKTYNDGYGHDMGDVVLRRIAETISETLTRTTDSASRFGGEEFVVLLPATDGEGASIIAERIRTYIAALAISNNHSNGIGVVSVSVGASSLEGDALNEIDLLKQADNALYNAKKSGRNQVKTFLNYANGSAKG